MPYVLDTNPDCQGYWVDNNRTSSRQGMGHLVWHTVMQQVSLGVFLSDIVSIKRRGNRHFSLSQRQAKHNKMGNPVLHMVKLCVRWEQFILTVSQNNWGIRHLGSGQLVPKTTRAQDNSYPGQPVPKTTRTQDKSRHFSPTLSNNRSDML